MHYRDNLPGVKIGRRLGVNVASRLTGAHTLKQAHSDPWRAPDRGGKLLGEGLAAAGDATEVDTAGVEPGQGRDRAGETRGQADQPVGAIGRGERRLNGGAPALHGAGLAGIGEARIGRKLQRTVIRCAEHRAPWGDEYRIGEFGQPMPTRARHHDDLDRGVGGLEGPERRPPPHRARP
jgi:hypothetical protein